MFNCYYNNAICFITIVKPIAIHVGAVDIYNKIKVHKKPSARLEKFGIYAGVLLGYIIILITLLGYKNVIFTSFIVPIFLLAIPILNTIFTIIRRFVNYKPILELDNNHLHHKFLKQNLLHRRTGLIIYFIDIIFFITSIVYVLGDNKIGIFIYAILFIVVCLLCLKQIY